MSEFYRRFLAEDVRKMGAPSGRQVFLAAFGKHPGWDDHVEDLGLDSESLIFAKTLLYVQGIGGQIDSGAWEKLDSSQQLSAFKHVFLWQRGGQAIIGRMWSSSDGKGRKRYPMIVCAHCIGVPLEWALTRVLPRLELIEQACASTNSAADVRNALDRLRTELRTAIANVEGSPTPPLTSAALGEFVNHSALGPEKEGWFRILYQMQSQMAPFAPGRFSIKGDLSRLRPQQIRVPSCVSPTSQALLLWSNLFQSQLDPAVPVLYTFPVDENWVDVTAGEPTPQEIFALRASPKAMPLISEVPYNLEPAFRDKARAQVAAFAGETAMKARPTAGPQVEAGKSNAGGRPKLLRWFGGGAAILIIGLAAIALIPRLRDKAAEEQARIQQQSRDDGTKVDAERKAQADAKARADAEARAKADALAKAKADEEARRLALAAEAQKRRQAEEQAKARADAEARAKAEAAAAQAKLEAEARAKAEAEAKARAEQPKAVTPVIASVVPPPVSQAVAKPADSVPLAQSTRLAPHITNRIGLELVMLSDDLWVGKYEVTQGEYVKLMENNPSAHTGNPRLPVDSVTWEEARQFCKKLTESEKAAGSLPTGFIYDLPTQAQWETFVSDATFEQAVTSREATRTASEPVGSQPANKRGLYDVLGNDWHWCLDGPRPATAGEEGLRGGALNQQNTLRFLPFSIASVRTLPPLVQTHDVG